MWTDARTAEVESGGARGERRVGRQVLERAAHTAVEIGARGPVRERTARQATAELAHWLQWRGKLARSNRIESNRPNGAVRKRRRVATGGVRHPNVRTDEKLAPDAMAKLVPFARCSHQVISAPGFSSSDSHVKSSSVPTSTVALISAGSMSVSFEGATAHATTILGHFSCSVLCNSPFIFHVVEAKH